MPHIGNNVLNIEHQSYSRPRTIRQQFSRNYRNHGVRLYHVRKKSDTGVAIDRQRS